MQHLSAEDFLDHMQQLVLNSALNSTYKLALIMSIVDASLKVSAQAVKSEICTIELKDIALEFLRIYWPQCRPYPSPSPNVAPGVLHQGINKKNNLKQSDRILTIVNTAIDRAREEVPSAKVETFEQISRHPLLMKPLVADCLALLKKNPLKYIAADVDFLYELKRDHIELYSSTVILLQRFRPIIKELIESRWLKHIRSNADNAALLGESTSGSLRDFLFDPTRGETLENIRSALLDATHDERCFYCGKALKRSSTHVDHFLPFTRYADTRIFNFVLACPSCNASKSNWLVGPGHVDHWVRRNSDYGTDLLQASKDIGPAGPVAVADMALTLYGVAQRHAEPLWLNRTSTGTDKNSLLHDPSAYESILISLNKNRRSMLTLAN